MLHVVNREKRLPMARNAAVVAAVIGLLSMVGADAQARANHAHHLGAVSLGHHGSLAATRLGHSGRFLGHHPRHGQHGHRGAFSGHRIDHHGHGFRGRGHRSSGHGFSPRHGFSRHVLSAYGSDRCQQVFKDDYHDGRPARIGGTRCRDRQGNPYIVGTSRFVVEYY